MELIFNNYQPGLWISEFEVTQDFNLHIEREHIEDEEGLTTNIEEVGYVEYTE